jgi:cytochrome c biogenesis protein CcmG, thiol:disulfide interchange protein DsbE
MSRGIAVAVLLVACSGMRPPFRPPAVVGKRADVASRDLAGRDVDVLARPARARVVDFWASWCEPCREQLPHLDRLARTYGDRGLAVYGVAFDEDRALVEAFLRATPVSFPVLWEKGGGAIAGRFDVTRLPTTLVVDAAGVIRSVHLGYDAAEGAMIEAEVQRLLGP